MPRLAPIQSSQSERAAGRKNGSGSVGKEGSVDKGTRFGRSENIIDDTRASPASPAMQALLRHKRTIGSPHEVYREVQHRNSPKDSDVMSSVNAAGNVNEVDNAKRQPHSHVNKEERNRNINVDSRSEQDRDKGTDKPESDQSDNSTSGEPQGHDPGQEDTAGQEGSKVKPQRSCKGRLYRKLMEENGKGGKPSRRETRVRNQGLNLL